MDKVTNLDDFGSIKLTHVSIMVNSPYFNWAIETASRLRLDTGLHLTTWHRSYRSFLLDYFIGLVNEEEIYWYWDKQINKMNKTGLFWWRIDSHWGTHLFPHCWKPLMALMKKHQINYVRNPPCEFCWFYYNPKEWLGKNISWLFYQLNELPNGVSPLPYNETYIHCRP